MVVAIIDGCSTLTRFRGKGTEKNNEFHEDTKKLDFYVDQKEIDSIMEAENATRKTEQTKEPEVTL